MFCMNTEPSSEIFGYLQRSVNCKTSQLFNRSEAESGCNQKDFLLLTAVTLVQEQGAQLALENIISKGSTLDACHRCCLQSEKNRRNYDVITMSS